MTNGDTSLRKVMLLLDVVEECEIAEVPHELACERDRASPQSWGWSRGRARVEFAHDVTHLYLPQAPINHIFVAI
jgi:hypothetical protein